MEGRVPGTIHLGRVVFGVPPKTSSHQLFRADKSGKSMRGTNSGATPKLARRTCALPMPISAVGFKSLSVKWVERATSPCRWATCPAEWRGAFAEKPTPACQPEASPFRRAGNPASHTGCLCYPNRFFRLALSRNHAVAGAPASSRLTSCEDRKRWPASSFRFTVQCLLPTPGTAHPHLMRTA